MGYFGFTPGTVLATDPLGQAAQRQLELLDPSLVLAFNTKLKRFEVWNKQLTSKGVFYGFIMRVDDGKGGFAEPGQWLIDKLKSRDSAYAGAEEAAQNVLREIRESERAALEADQKKDDDAVREVAEEIAHDFTLEAQLKSDPHITGKRRYEWDPEPIKFGQTGARERIRKEGQTE
jgi:hypothetical protein